MKTKIYLTMFTILMSVQIAIAQRITYGDQNENKVAEQKCEDGCDQTSENSASLFYKVDEVVPNVFTTGNNTLIVCRLIPGSETDVVCTTSRPEKGWGTMVSQENDAAYSYEEKIYKDGANIYSIAFTDPDNGWAVGVMESYSVNSGVVFHTEDGGKTWNLQFKSGTAMKLNSVGFTDAYNGWANGLRTVGNTTFEISLVTTDAGETWEEQNLSRLNAPNTY
jgi:photosystem II stability/assembly factor-like uncharacterized protein